MSIFLLFRSIGRTAKYHSLFRYQKCSVSSEKYRYLFSTYVLYDHQLGHVALKKMIIYSLNEISVDYRRGVAEKVISLSTTQKKYMTDPVSFKQQRALARVNVLVCTAAYRVHPRMVTAGDLAVFLLRVHNAQC